MTPRLRWLSLLLLLAPLAPGAADSARPGGYDIVGGAMVHADGSLHVGNRWIRLYGVYIPATGQHCRTFLRPVHCGTRAAAALNTRIQAFVSCRRVNRNGDGSLNAFCAVDRTEFSGGVDLGAHLIARGLAPAAPGDRIEQGHRREDLPAKVCTDPPQRLKSGA